jgi:hypothetical protein
VGRLGILLHFVIALLVLVILQVGTQAVALTLLTHDVRIDGLGLVSGTLVGVVGLLGEYA